MNLNFTFCCYDIFAALGLVFSLILLPLQKLVRVYIIAVSAALVLFANFLSARFVYEEAPRNERSSAMFFEVEVLQRTGMHLLLQFIIASLIAYLLGFEQQMRARLILLVYSLPLFARILGLPAAELQQVHHASATFMLLLSVLFLFNQLPVVIETLKSGLQYASSAIQLYGLLEFIMAAWIQMLLPLQFLVFWLVMFAAQFFRYVEASDLSVWKEGWIGVVLASASDSCNSPLSFLGACVTVTYLSKALLGLVDVYLGGCGAGDPSPSGMYQGLAEGVTMFILGIQTGLIDLKSSDRMFLLCIVLFIVLSSLVQSVFEVTDPILLWLAASQNRSVSKHVRAVALSTFLWVFPISMTIWICQFFSIDFWLLVVISTCILTSLQVLGSLFVYALLIFDSLRSSPSENLDDVIYCTKCLTRVLEFVVAVFVVGYGIERSLLDNWNWLNSSILIVHCYCNVWQRLQSGWTSFLQRRDAIKKLQLMKQATAQELRCHDDLCAICYQEMVTARITPCRHIFHSVCLKKWLFIQDYCPICHTKILDISSDDRKQDESRNPASTQTFSPAEDENSRARSTVQDMHSFSDDITDGLMISRINPTLLSTTLEPEGCVRVSALRGLQETTPEKRPGILHLAL